MPAPLNRFRYLGQVNRPNAASSVELFENVKDAKIEIMNRHRTGKGVRYGFDYHQLGISVDLDSVVTEDVEDPLVPGTTIELRPVHRDGLVEPHPRYLLTLGKRGGVSSVRLRRGKHPR